MTLRVFSRLVFTIDANPRGVFVIWPKRICEFIKRKKWYIKEKYF